ncbi:uncharacterized protein LOC121586101 [Coregonus clupeaformis]|uniref:uncharacterized protein LOC121586101 n=1 Tax=Coregonus clupeaformis TaxID=59861 RepID=UPI001E1C6724|nr:uncharacterized protein LOC121586101 [Coregonus clupeaformis]
MAQGYNTCFRNLPPLSSDSRTLNVPLDSEESLGHHLETLIEHNDLSNTVVSPENTSSDLNLSSNFFSNSNTSSDFVQHKYYDDVVWQDEGHPVHHGGQFNHTSNSLFSPARAASSRNCLSTSGADLNSHDLKQECDLLNPSIPEDYSDVSSCSESNVDRTGPSCEMLKHGSNDTPLVADDKKGNECAWKCPETNTGSPESMCASESEVEEDQDEPPEKEKETFMMQEDKYSETSGAPESLSVSEDEEEEDHLDGEAHDEKDETCMKQEGQHTDAPSGVEKSQTASVSEGKEELDDEAQNAGEEGYMEEEDRYSNVSSLAGQNEGTIIRESFKEKEAHSLSQGTMDSQGINTSNALDAANKLNDNTCSFEYHDSVKDNDSLKVAGQDNGKSSSVIYGLGLGGSNQTFESCLEFPENQSLKTRFQEIVGSGAQSTNSTYEESESDSIRASGGKEDHSSFDFLERCLGLNNSGIEQKSFIENEWLRPMDESNLSSCLEEDQTSQQNLMHHIEPPDLVKAGLENTREPFHKGFTADDEQEPPVLSECYGEPLSREDCMRDIEGNQEKGETGSIDSTELNHEGGDSTIDNIEDKRDFEDQAAELKSSLHVRKRMHPIVLLRNSELKNDTDGAYQCAACQQTTQSIDHLIEHHHCNHSENKFNFCQTCGTYLTRDSLAKKHQCGIIDENAQLSSNMKPQKRKSTGHTFHKCRYCIQTFYRLCDYNKHVQSHSVRTEHKCHRCGSYFSQSGSLNRHLCEKKCQRRSSQVPVKQIQTTPRISIYKKGTVHPYVLPPDSPYANLPDCFVKLVDICKEHVCRLCGKSFTSSAKLYKHGYNVHHTKTRSYNVRPKCQNTYRSYKCQKCQMTFNYSSNFSRHKKRCKGAETKEKFKCPLCPRLFKYSYNRSRHLREQCIKDFAQGSSGKVDMKFRCPFCTTTFTNASNRHRHIRLVCLKEYMHNETSRTKAERQENVDQKEKTQKPTLKTALNQNDLGLKCNYCPAVFAHSSGKYRHMRKHKLFENTGENIKFSYSSVVPISNKSKDSSEEPKDGPLSSEASSQPFSCRFCGKCFNASYSLKKHICSMHKGDKPYRCLECGKRFGKEIHLVAHKKVHQRRIQCTVCKKILPTIGDLIQHRQSHIKKGMLQCPDCPSQFQYPVYLLRHMASHHKLQQEQPLKEKKQRHPSKLEPLGSLPPFKEQEEEENLGCPLCPEVFHSATELSSHCLNHGSESSSSQCPFCKRLFSSRTSLVRHIRIHTGEKPFSCQSCGAPFRRKEYLQLHQEKCPGPQSNQEQPTIKESEDVSSKSLVTRIRKVYKCSYCPREFEKVPRLMLHHNGHMQNTVIPCPKCGKCYRQRRKLHERLCNGSNIKSEEPVSTVLHPCRNCGRKFSRDYNLNVHESTCNTVKPLQKNTSNSGNSNMHSCRNCGKYFTRSDNRNVHEKTCNSVKPLQKNTLEIRTSSRDKLQHKCPHCPSKFKYRSLLLRHIGSHTGERSYPCMHCGHSYAIQSRCLQHEAFCDGVNRQKPPSASLVEYKCNICTKTFMKSRNLRRHILTHTEVKPYRCKACDSCFSRHDHLKLHQSRCKGKRQRLEVRIAKVSLTDVGRGWQNNLNNTDSGTQQGFDCSICSKSFPTHSIMARHIAMSHAIRTISSFTHGKSLKRHTSVGACQRIYAKTKHSEKLNVTSPPSRETNRLLQRIQLQYKDKRKFKCTFCPRLFKSGEQLRVHTRLHTGEKPFGCSNCGERFIRRDYLQRHLNRCKGEPLDRVLCDRCGDVFSQDELENHLLTCVVKCKSPARSLTDSTARSPPKGFSCAKCSARFLLFSQLQQHFLNTHREAPTNQASPLQEQLSSMVNIKEEPMDEGYGDTQQNSDNNLMLNQDCDPNNYMNKPIECPQCNMHFGNKGGFARHMRTHLGQYPFNCKKCKKGFWNKNFCRTHVRKCKLVKVTKEEVDTVITSEMDPTLKETVLVFNQGSKTTGTGVLQTNFSCKDDLKDLTLQSSFGNQGKGSSSNDRTNCGQQVQGNKYQCSECDRSFTDGLLLISHLEDHGREELERKNKSCQHCGKTFANPSDLGRHMRVHWNEKTHSCPECPQTFLCPSDLDIHRTCHDSNRPFVCKECQQRFWTSQSLENHKSQAHPKELIYTCHVCNKNYSIRSSLVKHIRMKHQTQKNMDVIHVKEKETAVQEEFDMEVDVDGGSNASNEDENDDNDSDSADYFPCHVCGKTFTTSESLEDHQRCHLGEKPHECAECGKCFFQAGQLQQHPSHKSEYQCQICGRGFVSLFALRKHKHTHGKSRQHRCSKCPLSFTGPSQLAEHMGTHRDDNFPCDICDRTFSCKMSRAEHRKIHTETEDVPPPLLPPEKTASPSPTASSSTMKHLQYRCGVCNERFKEPEQLSEHGCMAARERPYSCQECNKHFLHASHLNKHELSHYQIPQSYVYRCNQCHMSFNYRHNFVSHLKKHGDDEAAAEALKGGSVTNAWETVSEKRTVYKCPICPHRFTHAIELASHLSIHSENTFDCSVCKLTFPTKNKLAEHERSHLTAATQYECTECGESFLGSDFRQHHCARRQRAVTDHERPHLSNRKSMEEEEEVDVGEDFFNCTVCLKRFSSRGSLQQHLNKEHPNERPFKCQSCGKSFALKRYLRDHERRQHKFGTELAHLTYKATDSERQYKCSVCPKTLTSAHDLSLHMKVHTEQESGGDHRCDMCYKSFSRLSLLRQHQESHVGQVVYECTECDKAFAFPHLLEEHQKTHAAGP